MNYTNFNKNEEFFVDMQRCIGCKACELACAECETNGQESLIHVNYVERSETIQTTVQVCMHCDDPVCASVCPADAISKDEFGIVHTANTERCIGCSNCVVACPFGVPKKVEEYDNKTAPLRDFYEAQGKFHSVDGIGGIDEITHRLTTLIDGLL